MNINEFLDYVNKNSDKFINYCEIVIERDGNINLARPSHQQTLIRLGAKANNISREEYINSIDPQYRFNEFIISKENMISVWYNYIKQPNTINDIQKDIIDTLKKRGLVNTNAIIEIVDGYNNYLEK